MRKTILTLLTLGLLAGLFALTGVASADSPHFKRGSPGAVADNGLTFSQKASVSGLGNGDIVVTLNITNVQPEASCTNPAGETKPPGQNPAPSDISGSVAVPGDAIKNGTLTITVNTVAPETPVPGHPNCPGKGSWTEAITDMSLTATSCATLTFSAWLDDGDGVFESGETGATILTATTPSGC